MTVFVIKEECHGFIGVAATEQAVNRFLLDTDWVQEYSGVWVDNDDGGDYIPICERYGENWKEVFLAMDKSQLADMGFYIREEDVWE